jgi:hypothetical protein
MRASSTVTLRAERPGGVIDIDLGAATTLPWFATRIQPRDRGRGAARP